MSNPSTIKVTIFGLEFTFKADDPEYIKELAAFVDGEIQKTAASGKVTSQTKAVILATFTIADELLRLRKEKESFSSRIESMLEMTEDATDLQQQQ